MAIPGYALRPGTVDSVRAYLNADTDIALADHLGLNRGQIYQARLAEQNQTAHDAFAGAAMKATAWPWQAFYAPISTRAA